MPRFGALFTVEQTGRLENDRKLKPVSYKEFGVGVSFTPTVLNDDRIHLDVTT